MNYGSVFYVKCIEHWPDGATEDGLGVERGYNVFAVNGNEAFAEVEEWAMSREEETTSDGVVFPAESVELVELHKICDIDIGDARDPDVSEKGKRIYYQSLVYGTCNTLDRLAGSKPGHGIVCGTAGEPSTELQVALTWLEDTWRHGHKLPTGR